MVRSTKKTSHVDSFQLQMALNASSIVAVTDAKGIITDVNEAFCKISKYTRDELLGQSHSKIKSGIHPPEFYKQLWKTITQGDVWNGEICNRSKDGAFYWVNSTIIPGRDQQGRIQSFLAIRHDITARKELERQHEETLEALRKTAGYLQNSIREMQTLFQNMSEGVVVHDHKGRIVQFNQAAMDILGLTANQLMGIDSFDPRWHTVRENGQSFPAEDHPAVAALRTGQRQSNIMMGVQRTVGELRWIAINAAPVFENGSKNVALVIVTFSDITEQRESEATLLQASKLSSLGEVSAAIAHEINNPLTVISGRAQQLLKILQAEHIDKKTLQQSVEKIHDNSLRISKIIRGLKAFTRNSANDPMEQVEVKALVDSTLTLCQARFKEYNTKLEIADLPDGLQVYCHSSQISQVLLNLLNNALDAVQVNPEEERLVELDYSEDKDSIIFAIADNGPGVPPSLRQKIMQAFFTTKAPGKGTGLGLSISLAIIQKHHGRLWLDESSPQTRFLVRLPKSQPQRASA